MSDAETARVVLIIAVVIISILLSGLYATCDKDVRSIQRFLTFICMLLVELFLVFFGMLIGWTLIESEQSPTKKDYEEGRADMIITKTEKNGQTIKADTTYVMKEEKNTSETK